MQSDVRVENAQIDIKSCVQTQTFANATKMHWGSFALVCKIRVGILQNQCESVLVLLTINTQASLSFLFSVGDPRWGV